MYLDHTQHSLLPSNSLWFLCQAISFQSHVLFILLLQHTATNQRCPYAHRCEVIYWTMGNLLMMPPPKSDSPSNSRYQLPISLQSRAGPLEPLHHPCWNFELSWSRAGLVQISTTAEFVHATLVSYSEDIISQHSPFSGFYILSVTSVTFPELWVEKSWYITVTFLSKHSSSLSSSEDYEQLWICSNCIMHLL